MSLEKKKDKTICNGGEPNQSKFQSNGPQVREKKSFKVFLPYMVMIVILVTRPEPHEYFSSSKR